VSAAGEESARFLGLAVNWLWACCSDGWMAFPWRCSSCWVYIPGVGRERGGKGKRKSRDAATVDGDFDLYTARWRGATKHDTVREVPRRRVSQDRSNNRIKG
jgi:hypothetical protein